MTRRFLLVVGLLLAPASAHAEGTSAHAARTLTLAEALDLAEKRNPQMDSARSRVDLADATVAQVRVALLPVVAAQGVRHNGRGIAALLRGGHREHVPFEARRIGFTPTTEVHRGRVGRVHPAAQRKNERVGAGLLERGHDMHAGGAVPRATGQGELALVAEHALRAHALEADGRRIASHLSQRPWGGG